MIFATCKHLECKNIKKNLRDYLFKDITVTISCDFSCSSCYASSVKCDLDMSRFLMFCAQILTQIMNHYLYENLLCITINDT